MKTQLRFEVKTAMLFDISPAMTENPNAILAKDYGCEFILLPPPEVEREQFISAEKALTKDGCDMVTDILVQSLVANIFLAHQEGYIPDHEHLKRIVAKLEEGFMDTTSTLQKIVK